ncbi:hypothetical protein LEP1GSC191_2798 [Leptospira borgpetersenii serovar Mini str. 201000851]|uniref:Uncharacterized protein n=1 Tax=Leptospira borgpetersenii str. 200801926 TaxID=1193009 RepID=A0ABN0HW59_LEPBO|nr:hypothetical protein LEP1GSC128_3332 [Leptospira borgpetersenii str. 200801926]ENO65043.1 hypothetical protein LEP1GSC191_2798 [Leptospira borgpetersenii serovar Mini str. 201000851]
MSSAGLISNASITIESTIFASDSESAKSKVFESSRRSEVRVSVRKSTGIRYRRTKVPQANRQT